MKLKKKVNLEQILPEGQLVNRVWLKEKGFNRYRVDYALRAGKLEALHQGVYRRPGLPLKWEHIVYSLNEMDYSVHVGGRSSLELHGLSHYMPLGDIQRIHLYCTIRVAAWVFSFSDPFSLIFFWALPCFSAGSGTIKWNYKTGGNVHTIPAVDLSGNIYFGSRDKYIYALNPNGTLRWKYSTSGWTHSSPAIGPDGVIYCGADTNYILALNPNGTLKWKFPTQQFVYGTPALGPQGEVYLGSGDQHMYALNPDGTLKWKYKTGHTIRSSPVIGLDGTIYFGSYDWHIYALNPNGTLKWKYKTGDNVWSSPTIGLDGIIYIGSSDEYIYAMNPDGTLKWKYKTNSTVSSSPAIALDGTIYFGSWDGYFYALTPSGTLKWKYFVSAVIDCSAVIGLDGTVYFAAADGWVYALYPNGSLKWNYGIGIGIDGSPTLAVDGTLYCGSQDGYMIAWNNSMNYHYSMPVFKPRTAFWSGLGITNMNTKKPANVTVAIYSQTGTVLATESKYIPAHGQSRFLIGTSLKNEGWIKIFSDQPLSGMNLFGKYSGTSTDYYLADVPFTSFDSLAKLLIIPHAAQNDTWDTIVYLANPNADAASVTLTYVSGNGKGATPHTVSIPANGCKEISLSTIGSSTSLKGGYVLISSTQGLTAFALYNNLKTGNFSYAGINAVDATLK